MSFLLNLKAGIFTDFPDKFGCYYSKKRTDMKLEYTQIIISYNRNKPLSHQHENPYHYTYYSKYSVTVLLL